MFLRFFASLILVVVFVSRVWFELDALDGIFYVCVVVALMLFSIFDKLRSISDEIKIDRTKKTN